MGKSKTGEIHQPQKDHNHHQPAQQKANHNTSPGAANLRGRLSVRPLPASNLYRSRFLLLAELRKKPIRFLYINQNDASSNRLH
jgi:hypothetical protein